MAQNTYAVTATDNQKRIPLRGDMDVALNTEQLPTFMVQFITSDFGFFKFKTTLGILDFAGNVVSEISIGGRPNTYVELMYDASKSLWRITGSNVPVPRRFAPKYPWELDILASVTLTATPLSRATAGDIVLRANVFSLLPIAKVEFFCDNLLIDTDVLPPYTGKDTVNYTHNGNRVYTAKVTTLLGITATSDPVIVTVNIAAPPVPDTTPPTVALSASRTSVTSAGTVKLTATASDDRAVSRVEILRGAAVVANLTAPPYTLDQLFSLAENGTISYSARAYDAANNVGQSNVVDVVVNIAPPVQVTQMVIDPVTLAEMSTAALATALGPNRTERRAAVAQAVIDAFKPTYVLYVYRNGATVFTVQFDSSLTVVTEGVGTNAEVYIGLGDIVSGQAAVAADINTGAWTFLLAGGADAQRTIAGTVGPDGSGKNITLSGSPFVGQEFDATVMFRIDRSTDGLA